MSRLSEALTGTSLTDALAIWDRNPEDDPGDPVHLLVAAARLVGRMGLEPCVTCGTTGKVTLSDGSGPVGEQVCVDCPVVPGWRVPEETIVNVPDPGTGNVRVYSPPDGLHALPMTLTPGFYLVVPASLFADTEET